MFSRNALAGLVMLVACTSAHAQDWTEQAVLSLFDQQSPMKRETRAAAAAAAEEMRGRSLWPNPAASYSRETVGFSEFFQAEQQLPVSGRLALARKAVEPARQALDADGAARAWDVRSSLRAAFYRALAAQQREESIQAALTEMQEVLRVLQAREDEGVGIPYDRIRIERETADLRADIAVARAAALSELMVLKSYLPAQTTLNRLTGELLPRITASSSAALLQQAMASRAEFRAQTSRIAQLDLEQQAADRLKIPEPTATAGLKRTEIAPGPAGAENANANGIVFGVSIPIPVFNRGQTEVARLGFERDRIQAQRDRLTQQVSALVTGAFDLYSIRSAALETFDRETTGSGQELLRISRVGYDEGEVGILQLLDAYRLIRTTTQKRLELQLAVREAEIELSRAAGVEVTQ
jgi:cobalt-zinc-cadmium efflux system outer membrane protein